VPSDADGADCVDGADCASWCRECVADADSAS
jgi:hypothetical protein